MTFLVKKRRTSSFSNGKLQVRQPVSSLVEESY
jgi:hypothetical protein